jgi:sucrose-6-phosphate hydrolase SacC (GH32 family)
VPLAIDASSDSMLVARAEIPVNIPSSILSVRGSVGNTSTTLPANSSLVPEGVLWAPSGMQEAFTQEEKDALVSQVPPAGRIQPKDFAFLYAGGKFHLFYIRLNMWDPLYRQQPGNADNTEKNFGHAVSTDLNHWTWVDSTRDTTVLQVRPGKWDNFHVWAPSIVQTDTGFTMIYTGVQQGGGRQHQQIGRATSPDLFNWTRYDTPILTVFDVPWAKRGTVVGAGQQLRDPFVMPDPANAGRWLMYFVAVDTTTQASMAVGVARSTGDLSHWTADQTPLRSTDSTYLAATRVESPCAFAHGNRWWLFFSPVDPAD